MRMSSKAHPRKSRAESLTGHASDAVEHLRLALDRTEQYRERPRWLAANDSDFDPIRNEPAFKS